MVQSTQVSQKVPQRSRSGFVVFLAILIVAAVVGVGFYKGHKTTNPVAPKVVETSNPGSAYQAELAHLDNARAAAEKELEEIKQVENKQIEIENDQKAIKVMLLEAMDPRHAMTVDATTDREYRRLKTAAVDLLVKIEGLDRIDGGYRLRLSIANPSAIKLGGMSVHVEWGKPYPADQNPTEIMDWLQNLKKRDVMLTDLFPSGQWTSIELELTPADESEIHAVTLQFKPLTLSFD